MGDYNFGDRARDLDNSEESYSMIDRGLFRYSDYLDLTESLRARAVKASFGGDSNKIRRRQSDLFKLVKGLDNSDSSSDL